MNVDDVVRGLRSSVRGPAEGLIDEIVAAAAELGHAIAETHLFRIERDAFDEVMADRPEIARGVIQALCQRLRMTTAAQPA